MPAVASTFPSTVDSDHPHHHHQKQLHPHVHDFDLTRANLGPASLDECSSTASASALVLGYNTVGEAPLATIQ